MSCAVGSANRCGARTLACRVETHLDASSREYHHRPGIDTSVDAARKSACATNGQRGFTLLEALVAAVIMALAVAGILGAISQSTRNAQKITQYDRATLLARQKMDELLIDLSIPRKIPMSGVWTPQQSGGVPAGWSAVVFPFEAAPGTGPGQWVVDRVQLEIWWTEGATRRSFQLEGFRRGLLRPGDL